MHESVGVKTVVLAFTIQQVCLQQSVEYFNVSDKQMFKQCLHMSITSFKLFNDEGCVWFFYEACVHHKSQVNVPQQDDYKQVSRSLVASMPLAS